MPRGGTMQDKKERAKNLCRASCSRVRAHSARYQPWKLRAVAASTFRKLKGSQLLPDVSAGVQYRDGVKRRVTAQQKLAAWPGGDKAFGLYSDRSKEAPGVDHDVR